MRCYVAVILVVLFMGDALVAQTAAASAEEQAGIVQFAQKAAVRSLTFNQGDIESLTGARDSFTPEGWREFLKHMNGFLDEKGAPTFSSSFVPSGDAVVVGQEAGMIHFKVPGTLTQTQNKSRTTYNHAEIDVMAGGKPIRITHLEQIYRAHER
jgi:hypothetical protein